MRYIMKPATVPPAWAKVQEPPLWICPVPAQGYEIALIPDGS